MRLNVTPVSVSSCLIRVFRTSSSIPVFLIGVAVMNLEESSSTVIKKMEPPSDSVSGPQMSVCTISHLVVAVAEQGLGAYDILPATHGTHTVPITRLASATDDGMPSTIVAARLRFSDPKGLKRRCHSSVSSAVCADAALADTLTGVTLSTYCSASFTLPTTDALSSTLLEQTASLSPKM